LIALGAWWLYQSAKGEGFRWENFRSALASLEWTWLAAAALCAIGTYWVRAVRWAVLIRPVSPHPRIGGIFTATVIGFAAVTLLGRAGEVVRPYWISVKEKVPFSSQAAAWLLERMFDTIIALLLFGFALARVRSSGAIVGPNLSWVLAVGGRFAAVTALISLAILILLRHFAGSMRTRLLEALSFLPPPRFARAERLVNAFVQGAEATRSNLALGLMVLYSVLEWLSIAVCYLCMTRAFAGRLHFSWTDVLIFMGFVSFGSVVQIPGIGGGVQVATVLVLTELFRVPIETASSFALLLWIMMFVVVVPFGAVLAVREGLNWTRLKRLRREVQL
jgi:glycosyltransferase 2 family protein